MYTFISRTTKKIWPHKPILAAFLRSLSMWAA
jgi:hypothetical protein